MVIDLEKEDDAAVFLGVTLEQERNTVLLEIKQTGLIHCVNKEVGLYNDMVKGESKPSEQRPLVKDTNDKPPSCMSRYSSVVGMIMYLSGHTIPDIYF